ncbi:Ig-like domain repeat protein [Pseudaminobacter soli (ex Li et al. 2025)]|uniref:Ig-like domain repeat protein n=1 Tax=Pseudaminobacter soli (ex Li et al. 2025) TaxID=1295366 RepID=UPI002473D481|nr:Ig-like domain repeat protein [Mesorhizobium soli]
MLGTGQVHAASSPSPTVTVFTSNANPALGESIVLTATLSGGSSPTGTVTFKAGTTTLGAGVVSADATASYAVSTLAVGAHSITAEYDGDTNNAAATSSAITVTVGQAAPTVTSVAVPANATYSIGGTLNFSVTFSSAVTVTGTPQLGLTMSSSSRNANYVSGSGSTMLTFCYTIAEGDLDADGISLASAVTLNGGTIQASGTDANLILNGVESTAGVLVDGVRPVVSSIIADAGAQSTDASVMFTVAFSKAVSNVSTNDFILTATGSASGTTSAVSASSGSSINVTVSGISGTGTIRLDIRSNNNIVDAAGNAMQAAFTSGTTHAVSPASPTVSVSASNSNPSFGASVTFTATLAGGSSPTGSVTFKDGTTTLGTATVSGTTVTFTTSALAVGAHSITAVYTGDTNNAAAASAAVSVAVGKAVPAIILSASDSNPSPGTSVTFTATLSGGSSPTGTVTFNDGATVLGTAIVSGTTATFTTSALGPGVHSISAIYAGDTNNATATYTAVTVTVGQAAPTITFSASDGNPSLGSSVTFTATLVGGSSPTGTVTFNDGATALGTATVSGTTATFTTSALGLGAHSITAVYAGDTNNATATSAAVTVTVRPAVTFVFAPADGSVLKQAMAGEDYRQPIAATGGTGTKTYGLASGSLPDGVILNVSTGELTGPLDATAQVKVYSFSIEVRDGSGATATASYTLEVKERVVSVINQTGTTSTNVNLEEDATGGPFSRADITFVEPSNAGTASIVRGEFAAVGPTPLGWYLKFIPNPAYSGTAKVGFRLTSTLGVSNTGVVSYTLGYSAAKVEEDIDKLVRGFVQTRQSLIASTIKLPGLLDRRRMATSADPVTARIMPAQDGITLGFATSLAQLAATRNDAVDVVDAELSPFNAWVDGTLMAHNREDNGNKWGSFGMISAGADYLVSEKALIGMSLHYDRTTDPTKEDAKLTGNGWLAGPYASLEIGKGVFWDTSLLYGGSVNDIGTTFWNGTFDTTRWMLDTSITGQWNLDEVTTLTPKLRAVYFSETIDDYAVENGGGNTISIDGFDEEQFRVSLGAEISRSFTMENGMALTPRLGVTGGFSGLDGSGAFGSVSAGLRLQTVQNWSVEGALLFNIEGDGQKSIGARAGVNSRF